MKETDELVNLVVDALENIKGIDIRILDVRDKTSVTDVMVIATGNTARQVRALANEVSVKCKEAGVTPLGSEGEQQGEWALVDIGDVVVHIMQPSIRDFYNLEKLWGEDSPSIQQES